MPTRKPRTPTTSDQRALAERALQFERYCCATAAGTVEEVPLGLWTRSSDHPKMWMLNQLHVIGPQPDLTADDLIAELDRGLADAKHRRAQVGDDATGRRLADDMAKHEGWKVVPVMVMVLDQEPDAPPPGLTREVDQETMLALETLIVAESEDIPAQDKGHVVQGFAHTTAAVPGTRFFIGAHDGTDASTTYLYTDGATAQLEDVGTLVAHRGLGLASATVRTAARAATATGCDLIFLVCNAATGPVPLYASLGFRPVGRYWGFTRPE